MQAQVRLGAICFILTGLFFVAQFAAQIAAPYHDMFLFDISLLGVTSCARHSFAASGYSEPICSPLHMVFNGGIILHGALTIAGAVLTWRAWPRHPLAWLALLALMAGGAGAIAVGIFPLGVDLRRHVLGATFAIAAPGAAILFMALPLWKQRPTLARWSLLTGLVILLAGLGHLLGGQPFGRGAMERLAVWPQTLWYMAVGVMFFGLSTPQKQ
jgi:hypothetical membrane protein